jgi:hypothetical protein
MRGKSCLILTIALLSSISSVYALDLKTCITDSLRKEVKIDPATPRGRQILYQQGLVDETSRRPVQTYFTEGKLSRDGEARLHDDVNFLVDSALSSLKYPGNALKSDRKSEALIESFRKHNDLAWFDARTKEALRSKTAQVATVEDLTNQLFESYVARIHGGFTKAGALTRLRDHLRNGIRNRSIPSFFLDRGLKVYTAHMLVGIPILIYMAYQNSKPDQLAKTTWNRDKTRVEALTEEAHKTNVEIAESLPQHQMSSDQIANAYIQSGQKFSQSFEELRKLDSNREMKTYFELLLNEQEKAYSESKSRFLEAKMDYTSAAKGKPDSALLAEKQAKYLALKSDFANALSDMILGEAYFGVKGKSEFSANRLAKDIPLLGDDPDFGDDLLLSGRQIEDSLDRMRQVLDGKYK